MVKTNKFPLVDWLRAVEKFLAPIVVRYKRREFLRLNRLRGNNIGAAEVSWAASLGAGIEIGKGSRVDGASSLDSYTYVGDYCSITRAKIGRYVSIGNNVTIGPGEHKLNRISTSAMFYNDPYEELTQGDCVIESDAWIGVDAVILRGVRIGVGAVVAANAVVTRSVPDFAVAAGVPARILKYRFDDGTRERLLKSEWWLKDVLEAKQFLQRLDDDIQNAEVLVLGSLASRHAAPGTKEES